MADAEPVWLAWWLLLMVEAWHLTCTRQDAHDLCVDDVVVVGRRNGMLATAFSIGMPRRGPPNRILTRTPDDLIALHAPGQARAALSSLHQDHAKDGYQPRKTNITVLARFIMYACGF